MSYQLKNLNKKFSSHEVLKDFTITFPDKGVVCIFGESGCGKTTLINVISEILNLDSGDIRNIKDITKSYIFQEDRLIPWLSVGENMSFVSKEKKGNRCKAEKILKSLNLHDVYDKRPSELSGGMRQRVNIARALFVDSKIIFMDEPFKGIDENNKVLAMDVIKQHVTDKLCIMITHSIEEVNIMAEKVYFVGGPPLKILEIKSIKDKSRHI